MGNSMDPVHITHTADATQVTLEASLGIADTRTLYEQLGTVLASRLPVTLDGGRLERLDAAAMQLLANFCRTVRAHGRGLTWQSTSPALQQAAKLLGLESLLGIKS